MSVPVLVALAALLFSTGCASNETPATPAAPGVVSAHGRLQVDHARIVGADGKPVSLAGVSYGWSQWEAKRFFNAGVINWLKQDWHADIIRAPLGIHEEDGFFQNPTENFNRVIAAIDAAIAADVYVIV
ncbi:MAG: cellulase family glycosylhydrolase, partial [Oleiharenicola lentus]